MFTFGQYYPYALSLPIQQNFMVVLWQMIFVMGMLAGAALPKWDALTIRGENQLARSSRRPPGADRDQRSLPCSWLAIRPGV